MSQPTDAAQTALEAVTDQITRIATDLDLGKPVQQSATLLGEKLVQHGIRVPAPQRTAAGCLLIACRFRGVPVRVTVVAEQTSATKANILNEMQRLSNKLDIGVPLDDPKTIIEAACRELALPATVCDRAIRLADIGAEAGVTSGISPYTYAAAVLYIVCSPLDEDISQAEIAAHLDVSTATLRNRRDDLLEATGSQLFALQFPNAPAAAASDVDDHLRVARTADWATNKRFLGLLAGVWLYVAQTYDIPTSAADLAALTGVSESTIEDRYEQLVEHIDTRSTNATDPNRP